MQNNLTKRILAQSKMKNVIKNQYTQLVSNTNTDWQYCPVEQLIQQKNEYDRFVAEQKLLNTVVNKVDPVTGQPYPGAVRASQTSLDDIKHGDKNDSPSKESFKAARDGSAEVGTGGAVRYEPHVITGEVREMNGKKEYQIRGIFRMDPRHDPNCKPVTDRKSRASSLEEKLGGTRSQSKLDVHRDNSPGKRLTSKAEQASMISLRK